ncbi:cyclase family protein [Streptomyces sp. NPDC059568]|uniref:cyclase family protein n=1 Tax=Streptomyces sp. NPDC059568 TaxID=3346868 RepID=UPI0036D00028
METVAVPLSPDDQNAEGSEAPDNWGRWGQDDQLGTLNLITSEVRAAAAAEVRTGQPVSLALPIQPAPILSGIVPPTMDASPVQQVMGFAGSSAEMTVDLMLVTNHHPGSTHIDALGHYLRDDLVYPGRPHADTVTPAGLNHASTTAFASGIVTRGVFLDLAADGPLPAASHVTAADLEAAEQRLGVQVRTGDALVVRFGWPAGSHADGPLPGMTLDAVCWMHDRGVSLYAGDLGDALPPLPGQTPFPLHRIALAKMGMPLIDHGAHVRRSATPWPNFCSTWSTTVMTGGLNGSNDSTPHGRLPRPSLSGPPQDRECSAGQERESFRTDLPLPDDLRDRRLYVRPYRSLPRLPTGGRTRWTSPPGTPTEKVTSSSGPTPATSTSPWRSGVVSFRPTFPACPTGSASSPTSMTPCTAGAVLAGPSLRSRPGTLHTGPAGVSVRR